MITCKDFFEYGKKNKLEQVFVYVKVAEFLVSKVGLKPNSDVVDAIADDLSEAIFLIVEEKQRRNERLS